MAGVVEGILGEAQRRGWRIERRFVALPDAGKEEHREEIRRSVEWNRP